MAGARSGSTDPAFGVRFRALIVSECCPSARIFRSDWIAGAFFTLTPATRSAELHTPTGYFVNSHDNPLPDVISTTGNALQIGGLHMVGNIISGFRIGI